MPYIIDGHNLIPKVPGLSLEAVDDEMKLVELLQEFCRLERKQAEVFFDNAPPGGVRARKFGLVTARFVRQGSSADEAIRNRLNRLGGQARNWTIVSSDRAVQSAARAVGGRAISSEEFAGLMAADLDDKAVDAGEDPDAALAPDEIDDWLLLFGSDEGDG